MLQYYMGHDFKIAGQGYFLQTGYHTLGTAKNLGFIGGFTYRFGL